MPAGDGRELFIELGGSLNRLCHLNLKHEDKKENSHTFYTAAQHYIYGMNSSVSIIQSLNIPEHYIGFRECRASGVFEQVEKDLADLGVIFFYETAERPDDTGTQGAWDPL